MPARGQFLATISFTMAKGLTWILVTTYGTGLVRQRMQVAVPAAHFFTAITIIILPRAGIRGIHMLRMGLTELLRAGAQCCLALVGPLTVPGIRRRCPLATQPP